MKHLQILTFVACSSLLIFQGCKSNQQAPSINKTKTTPRKSTSLPTSRRAGTITQQTKQPASLVPPTSWVKARVATSRKRLLSSEGGRLIWKAIQAHGGLQRWFSNGPLFFRFTYKPVSKGKTRDSYQTIDVWSARARHEVASHRKIHYGWNGNVAWKKPEGAKTGTNPRFWSLTPYYFVAVPFVFADKGVVLKKEKPLRIAKRVYEQVRVTFKPGTGDAPDDFYVVLIDRKTGRVGGVRYIVTYRGFFSKGKHSPEKLMLYDGAQVASGITFPKSFRTFTWNGKRPVKLVTNSLLRNVAFRPKTPVNDFKVPTGAEVLKGLR